MQCRDYPVTTTLRLTNKFNSIKTPQTERPKIRCAARLPPDGKINLSCHTLENNHEQEDITVPLKISEGALTQTENGFRIERGGITHDKCVPFQTKLPVPGARGVCGQEGLVFVWNGAARRDSSVKSADGLKEGILYIRPVQILDSWINGCPCTSTYVVQMKKECVWLENSGF